MNAVGEQDGLIDVVCDKQHRDAALFPYLQPNQLDELLNQAGLFCERELAFLAGACGEHACQQANHYNETGKTIYDVSSKFELSLYLHEQAVNQKRALKQAERGPQDPQPGPESRPEAGLQAGGQPPPGQHWPG
jgi:hypothetical protein